MHINFRLLLIIFLTGVFTSCSFAGKPGTSQNKKPSDREGFERYRTEVPENFRTKVPEFYSNITYGTTPAQKVDIMIPSGPGPHPLLIYFHGGGFIGGKKEAVYNPRGKEDEFYQAVQAAVKAGIAIATADYTMLNTPGNKGVISALRDGQRVVKFFRYHAESLDLDPDRIAVFGGSAGGGIALWIATTEENVTTDINGKKEPYLQVSPNVVCAAAYNSQSTYDVDQWFNNVFSDYDLSQATMIVGKEAKRVEAVYNINSMKSLDAPATKEYRSEVDIMGMLDPGDPPIWMGSPKTSTPTPQNFKDMFHHPAHVRALKQRRTISKPPSTIYRVLPKNPCRIF